MRDGILAVAVALALLAGCAASSQEPAVTDSSLPAGAIKTGDGTYMVPIAKDGDGCMQYRMYAPGQMVVQAIFYADGKGGFTMDRAEAGDCPPPKVPGSGG